VVGITVTYSNIVLQTVALALAVHSLGTHQDGATYRVFAGSVTVLGMVLIFGPSYVTTLRNIRAGAMTRRGDPAAGGAGGAGG
jgi:hypothetical protein